MIDQRKSLEMIKTAQAKLEASYKTKKSPQVGFPLGMALALQADDWSVNRMDEVQRGAPASPLAAEAYLILAKSSLKNKISTKLLNTTVKRFRMPARLLKSMSATNWLG